MVIKAVAFDLEGTLIELTSSWKALHGAFGTTTESGQNFTAYQHNHREWMLQDAGVWVKATKGNITKEMMLRKLLPLELREGAEEIIAYLKSKYVVGLVTQAIDVFADEAAKTLGIDHVVVDRFTYNNRNEIVGVNDNNVFLDKGYAFERFAKSVNLNPREIAVVGDSSFDEPMFYRSEMSIAIRQGNNEHLRGKVNYYIDHLPELTGIL